ncbi:MAG TPA: DUF934 domain-containing protein [Agitococcus sp.]|nr:DUF934 domain-containing protein [Agitococcus sp.]HNB19578.1 DUF934 domain-containing protein [Agitococcus sp.]HNG09957.1 DUF934 domain-containing protein [Agitococcus sp.]HNG46787.1 DUF934 domain-containing protein [Agitococcus sp.]HNL36000.1 DUF934 domain-containing protein [Agitococcus sp.]
MPNIIKDGAIVADTYQLVTEAGALPAQDIVVSLDVWQQQREAILAHPYKKAVLLKPDQHPEVLVEDVKQLDMIALDFPAFADGRGYSYATLLRQRFGFTGELRATGDVFKDNLFYLKRCGFNSFAVRADKDIHVALQGLNNFSESYQASVDESRPLYRRRFA